MKSFYCFIFLKITFAFITSCQALSPTSLHYTRKSSPKFSLDDFEFKKENYVSIVQGYTDEKKTYISVVSNKFNKYFVYEKGFPLTRREVLPFKNVRFRAWKILKFKVLGLELNKTYVLESVDEKLQVVDERYFKALDLSQSSPTLVVGSCMHEGKQIQEQKKIWSHIINTKPDVLFLLGDNVYVDSTYDLKRVSLKSVNPEWMFKRYIEARVHIPFYYSRKLIPTLVTWDDHDFGFNDIDSSFRYAKESAKIFNLFWVQGDLEKGPGVSSFFQAFGQNFIFLDNRSFRVSSKASVRSHFGESQEKWLMNKLEKFKKPSWIISGGQFFGGAYPWESYETSHPKLFKNFKTKLRNIPQPLLLLSGDRHFSEIMRLSPQEIGQETFEITASPLHSFLYPNPWKVYENKRQIAGKASVINYTVLEPYVYVDKSKTDDKEGDLKVNVTLYGSERQIFYEESLMVEGRF